MIHLDTSFLVDVLREARRSEAGPATGFLERLGEEEVRISIHVACELFAGAALAPRPSKEQERVERLCSTLELVVPDERFAPVYGRLLAGLRKSGQPVATMDLLIATAAVVDEASLVTRNIRHFEPVPDLELREY